MAAPATFHTPVGVFTYHAQHRRLYARGMTQIFRRGRSCLIATREKALLDTLTRRRLRARDQDPGSILRFVVEGLRVPQDELLNLDLAELRTLSPLYRNLAPAKLTEALALVSAA